MNILIVNVDHKPEQIGGIKRVSSILAVEWIKAGHCVRFVGDVPISCREDRFKTISGVEQIFLPSEIVNSQQNLDFLLDFIKKNGIDVFYNPHGDERQVCELCFNIRKKSDVRLVTAWHFAPLAFVDEKDAYHLLYPARHSFRSRLTALKWKFIDKEKEVKKYTDWFKNIERNSDNFVFLSKRFLPLVENLLGYRSDKITAINNPSVFDSIIITPNQKKNKVVWCGRLGYGFKRTDIMMDVWQRVSDRFPDWECVIMGGGDIKYWESLAAERGIKNITFTGFCEPKEHYADAKIFCLTSTSEGWGLVLIEAMTFGCVPIAFDSFASVSDILTDGINGLVIMSFDVEEYAQKLCELMSDSEMLEHMSTNSRKISDRFTPEDIARNWIELFESEIEKKQ